MVTRDLDCLHIKRHISLKCAIKLLFLLLKEVSHCVSKHNRFGPSWIVSLLFDMFMWDRLLVFTLYTTLQLLFYYDHVDFALDYKSNVDRFHSNLDDSSELGCIIQTCK